MIRLALGDAHLDRGAHLLGQIVERVEHGLELGAKPVNLVDEVEQHRHLILVEAELVLEVADQRRPRHVGFGEALGWPWRLA